MKPLVTIAIPDLAGAAALAATLASLSCHTPEPHEVVLLKGETAGKSTRPGSDGNALRHQFVPAPFGIPGGLNRLLMTCTAPHILLLESGAIVTSGWLGRLLAPFDDPAVGLSGPSTNASWNEQKVLRGAEGMDWSVAQIEAYALGVARQYTDQRRSLDTLHSLGDFCYLFKRAVAEQLGGFDEAYGAGPCWEIDFATRAARAGFRAIWVLDAYVHRRPMSPWKAMSTRRYFTANKHLYQDRFCGLRLRGEKSSYEEHCRGEDCEHFAPAGLIQVTLKAERCEQPTAATPVPLQDNHNAQKRTALVAGDQCVESRAIPGGALSDVDANQGCISGTADEKNHSTIASPALSTGMTERDLPLVSCIMPTRNRREFVRQALRYFERQDYPNRELLIVDDGEDRVSDLIQPDSRLRYIALPERTSIGAKRNIACEQAQGAIIAHWDDDDWYAPHRLKQQVAPLLNKSADISGLEASCFFDLTRWQTWTCTPDLHRRLFVGDVHGGTLVYWRWVWERLARYPASSLAEDALFLRQACRRGARLQKLPHASSFVYIRHGSNAWNFPLGSYLQQEGWKPADLHTFLPAADLSFYQALSPAAATSSSLSVDGGQAGPLVSCIMPTHNRRTFVPQAIRYFLRQDYPDRELIIVDDGDQSVDDLVPSDPRIRYIRLGMRMILGAKRNLACELARGSIIAHWDDDDWIAPQRLSYQLEVLERERADLCGAGRQLYYNPATNQAWLYEYPPTLRRWLAGNTLCYRKAFWEKNPFPEVAVGEDTRFVWNPKATHAAIVPDHTFYVGLVHDANTSRKNVTGQFWHPHPVESVRQLLGQDVDFYYTACRGGAT